MCWSKSCHFRGCCSSRVSRGDVIFGSGLASQAGEMRARQSKRLSPADGKSCIHCSLVPLHWWLQWCPLRVDSGDMVSCNCRCVAVRGQPANAGDDSSKRPSSPTCRLASVPLVTSLHRMLVAFTQRCRDSSPEWDVSQQHGCVTTQRGFLGLQCSSQ